MVDPDILWTPDLMPKLGRVWADDVKVQPPYWLVVPSSRNAGFLLALVLPAVGQAAPLALGCPPGIAAGGQGESSRLAFWPISPLLVEQPCVALQTWLLRYERDNGSLMSQDGCEDGEIDLCAHDLCTAA